MGARCSPTLAVTRDAIEVTNPPSLRGAIYSFLLSSHVERAADHQAVSVARRFLTPECDAGRLAERLWGMTGNRGGFPKSGRVSASDSSLAVLLQYAVSAASLFRLASRGERGLGKLDQILAPFTLLAIAALARAALPVELLTLAGIMVGGFVLLHLRRALAARQRAR
jgi:hypothetical protein